MSNGTTLNAEELRVLACLMEKSHTTPDQYPLSSNALTTACNQKSSRDPVVDYSAQQVDQVLQLLRDAGWVRMIRGKGNRTFKHRHVVDEKLGLTVPQQAVLAVLALRGPQSPGELKTRTERYHRFEGPDEVEAVLHRLADGQAPLVRNVGRASGQSQDRWIQLLGPSLESANASGSAHHAGDQQTTAPTPQASRSAPPRAPRIDGSAAEHWQDHRLAALSGGGWDAVRASTGAGADFDRFVRVVQEWNDRFRVHSRVIQRTWSAAEIERAMAERRTAALLTAPDPSPLNGDPDKVEICGLLGLRLLALGGPSRTPLVDTGTEQGDEGLTAIGREVVAEMDRVGLVPDLQGCGTRSAHQIIDAFSGPVVLSAANDLDAANGARKEIRTAVAASDGLAVFNLAPAAESGRAGDVTRFCEAVADAALTHGAPHIAIGSGRTAGMPDGLDPVVDELAVTGFEPSEIEAMSGGNWLRVLCHPRD